MHMDALGFLIAVDVGDGEIVVGSAHLCRFFTGIENFHWHFSPLCLFCTDVSRSMLFPFYNMQNFGEIAMASCEFRLVNASRFVFCFKSLVQNLQYYEQ